MGNKVTKTFTRKKKPTVKSSTNPENTVTTPKPTVTSQNPTVTSQNPENTDNPPRPRIDFKDAKKFKEAVEDTKKKLKKTKDNTNNNIEKIPPTTPGVNLDMINDAQKKKEWKEMKRRQAALKDFKDEYNKIQYKKDTPQQQVLIKRFNQEYGSHGIKWGEFNIDDILSTHKMFDLEESNEWDGGGRKKRKKKYTIKRRKKKNNTLRKNKRKNKGFII